MTSLFILLPFALLIILNLPFKYLKGRAAFWLSIIFLSAQTLACLLDPWLRLSSYRDYLGIFYTFNLSLDNLSLVMLFTIGVISAVSLIVGKNTIPLTKRFNFINLILVSVIGMNAVVLVTDIFSLYVAIEITAVAVFVLISIERGKAAIEGTFKYLMLSVVASVFLLTAVAFFLLSAGDTSFREVNNAFLLGANAGLLKFAAGLFLCGLFIKSGVMPFHGWVPDAYSQAPSAVSILLAGIVTKISGVYLIIRLCSSVFILNQQFQNVIMILGLFSILVAALAAFKQTDIKRMLSYSSISQVGYIILAVGCGTPLAYLGAVLHFFNHAIFKSLLFVNSASLQKKFGSSDLSLVNGLGRNLPVTNITSLVGLLSTAGIPPLSGFWSKVIIIIALFVSGKFLFGAVALLASILTLGYFLYLERSAFFVKPKVSMSENSEVPAGIKFCEILLALITVGVGAALPFILNSNIFHLKEMFH